MERKRNGNGTEMERERERERNGRERERFGRERERYGNDRITVLKKLVFRFLVSGLLTFRKRKKTEKKLGTILLLYRIFLKKGYRQIICLKFCFF